MNSPALAKCISRCVMVVSLIAVFGLRAPCSAEPPPCDPSGLIDDKDAIWRALTPAGLTPEGQQSYWNRPCADTVCLAATDLSCAFHAMLSRDIPNSMGRGNTTDYDLDLPGYVSIIRGIGRKHPERVGIYCALLTKIARLDEETLDTDHLVSLWTIELAGRLYALGHKICMKQVMDALPRTPGMSAVIDDARQGCVLYKYPGCAGITR